MLAAQHDDDDDNSNYIMLHILFRFLIFYFFLLYRNRQVNHARNIWDRAVSILPRANQFWYKYTYMEEMLENVAGLLHFFFFLNTY